MNYKEGLEAIKTTLKVSICAYDVALKDGVGLFVKSEEVRLHNEGAVSMAKTVLEMIEDVEKEVEEEEIG